MYKVVKKTKFQKICNNIILAVLVLMFFAGFWAMVISIVSFEKPPVDVSEMGFLEIQVLIYKTKWKCFVLMIVGGLGYVVVFSETKGRLGNDY